MVLLSGCVNAISRPFEQLSDNTVRLNADVTNYHGDTLTYWFRISETFNDTARRTIAVDPAMPQRVSEDVFAVPGAPYTGFICVQDEAGRPTDGQCTSLDGTFGTPAPEGCGELTHDLTLTEDLVCFAEPDRAGITVAADNLTIDLNGHRLTVRSYSNNQGLTALRSNRERPDREERNHRRRLEPVQKRIFGGCHLTRPVVDLLTRVLRGGPPEVLGRRLPRRRPVSLRKLLGCPTSAASCPDERGANLDPARSTPSRTWLTARRVAARSDPGETLGGPSRHRLDVGGRLRDRDRRVGLAVGNRPFRRVIG